MSNEAYTEVVNLVVDFQRLQKDLKLVAGAFKTNMIEIRRNSAQTAKSMNEDFVKFFQPDRQAERFRRVALAAGKQMEVDQANMLRRNIAAEKEASRIRIAMYRDEAAQRARLHQQSMPTAPGGPTVGQGLRIGAGVAGALGGFQAAAAMYALERVSVAAGVAQVSIASLGRGFAVLGATVGVVAATLGIFAAGLEFNTALAKMSTLLEDVNVSADKFAASLGRTAELATVISRTFNLDLIDVVTGFKTALSSGINSDQLEEFSHRAGELAGALGISLDEAANVLTSFKDAYGLTVEQLETVNDQLFNLVNIGKINIQQLLGSIGRVLPVASAARIGFDEIGGAIATLTREAMTSPQAITAVTNLLKGIVSPSDTAKKAFQKLGIQFGQAALEGKGFIKVIEEIGAATGGSLEALEALFPEERAARGAAGLLQNVQLTKELAHEMNVAGTASKAWERSMDSFGQNAARVWKAVSNEFKLAGSQMLDWANKLIFGGGPLSADTLNSVANAVKLILIPFKALGYVLAGIGAVLGFVADAWIEVGSAMYTAGEAAVGWVAEAGRSWKNWIVNLTDGKLSFQDVTKSVEDTTEALKQYHETSSEAAKALSNPFAQTAEQAEEAAAAVEKLLEKVSKIREKDIESKATDFQKNMMQSLKDKIDVLQYYREHAKELITKDLAKNRPTDTVEGTAAYDDAGVKELARSYKAWSDEIDVANSKLKDLNDTIYGQDTTASIKANEALKAETRKQFEELDEEKRRRREQEREEENKFKKEILDEADKLYKQDVENYQKAQEAKKKATEKVLKQIEKAHERSYDRIAGLMAEINANALAGAGDNAGRKKKIAGEQLETARGAIQGFLSGGGSSEKEFLRLQAAVAAAADALFEATSDISGAGRAAQGKDVTLREQLNFENQFSKNQTASLNAQIPRGSNGLNAPSYSQSAEQAAGNVQAARIIEERTINLGVTLSADGTTSSEQLKELAVEVGKILEDMSKQGNSKSNYDNDSFSGGRNDDE